MMYVQDTWLQACEASTGKELEQYQDGILEIGGMATNIYRRFLKTPEGDFNIEQWQYTFQHLLECRSIPVSTALPPQQFLVQHM